MGVGDQCQSFNTVDINEASLIKQILDDITALKLVGGGIYQGNKITLVDDTHPQAANDGNILTPFKTIQHALDTIGEPKKESEEASANIILIRPGPHDEDLTIPAAGNWWLMGLGQWVLGDGAGDSGQSSSKARNITWIVDPTKTFTNRPSLYITNTEAIVGHTGDVAFGTGVIISGDLKIGSTANKTQQLYLKGVDIIGDLDGSALTSSASGDRVDTYMMHSRIQGAVTGAGKNIEFKIVEDSEFQGLVEIDSYCRFVDCEIQAGMTIVTLPDGSVPPEGFINCDFSGAFEGPALSFIADAVTIKRFNDNGATFTSPATSVLLDFAEGIGVDPTNFSVFLNPTHVNLQTTLDKLDKLPHFSVSPVINKDTGEITINVATGDVFDLELDDAFLLKNPTFSPGVLPNGKVFFIRPFIPAVGSSSSSASSSSPSPNPQLTFDTKFIGSDTRALPSVLILEEGKLNVLGFQYIDRFDKWLFIGHTEGYDIS